jgi:sugar phosphate permease
MAAPNADDLKARHYQLNPKRVYMILVLMTFCYFGKYYCTSNMYITQTEWLKGNDFSPVDLSIMFALGFVLSMVGKPAAGILSDSYGGKPVCMVTAGGYIFATLIFSFVPEKVYGLYMCCWAITGFFALGIAWVSVVATCTSWVPDTHIGRLMAPVNMAPQLGDALARASLAPVMVAMGSNWRGVFQIAAGAAALVTLPALLFVPNEPTEEDVGGKSPPAVDKSKKAGGEGFMTKVRPLLKQPTLYVVGALSGTLYAVRACFLLYAVSYLDLTYCTTYDKVASSSKAALDECTQRDTTAAATALASTSYTIMGCISVLIVGYAKDTFPAKHRASILVSFLSLLLIVLGVMFVYSLAMPYSMSAVCIALVGFSLFGPYKILGTAFAVDIGGKKLKATACSFMGFCDNFMAVVVLLIKGKLGDDWHAMLGFLLGFGFMCWCCACLLWKIDMDRAKLASAREGSVALLDGEECLF